MKPISLPGPYGRACGLSRNREDGLLFAAMAVSGRRATLADVAGRAGVSKSIASRVLNNYPDLAVRDETRARIIAVAESLAYRPHALARNLARASSGSIALLVPAMSNPVYVQLVRGAYRRAAETGYVLLLAEDFDDQAADESFAGLVESGRVDGLLIASARPGSKIVPALAQHSVPHVFVNRAVPDAGRSVVLDMQAASELTVDHLFRLGHRRFGHISGPRGLQPTKAREDSFRTAAKAAGATVRIGRGDFSEAGGAEATERLLRAHPDVTALYATSLSQAIGALHAARELGIRVPEDLSVVGYDEAPLAGFLAPPLTTIAMPLADLGAAAVDELLKQIRGGEPADVVLHAEPELVVRASTAPAHL